MRKLFYLGFCLALAMGFGCAITDYVLMTDYGTGEIISTNGKAMIAFDQGIAIGDGTNWHIFYNMVDQKANGNRVLTTYAQATSYDDPIPWLDYFYCTPDRNGCSIWTADDPEVGDVDPFDGKWNINCQGATLLYSLLSSSRYYGECGRAAIPVQDRLNFLAAGNLIDEYTLGYNMNAGNTTLILDNNAGVRSLVPLLGNVNLQVGTYKMFSMHTDMSNPLVGASMRWMADWNDTYGTGATTMTVIFNGVVKELNVNLLSDNLNAAANRL
jgi:hypothetical protein